MVYSQIWAGIHQCFPQSTFIWNKNFISSQFIVTPTIGGSNVLLLLKYAENKILHSDIKIN